MDKKTSRLVLYQLCKSREVIESIAVAPEKAKELTNVFAFSLLGNSEFQVNEFFRTDRGRQVSRQFNVVIPADSKVTS